MLIKKAKLNKHTGSTSILNNKIGWTTDKLKLVDSQKLYAEWKKPVSKGYILYDSIYTIFSKRPNCNDEEMISGCRDMK